MLHTGSKSMLEKKGKKIKATDDQCVTTFHKEGELTKKEFVYGMMYTEGLDDEYERFYWEIKEIHYLLQFTMS